MSRFKQAIADLLHGKDDRAQFSQPMEIFLGPATGKAFWRWLASHGELAGFAFSDREDTEDGRVLRYKLVVSQFGVPPLGGKKPI